MRAFFHSFARQRKRHLCLVGKQLRRARRLRKLFPAHVVVKLQLARSVPDQADPLILPRAVCVGNRSLALIKPEQHQLLGRRRGRF